MYWKKIFGAGIAVTFFGALANNISKIPRENVPRTGNWTNINTSTAGDMRREKTVNNSYNSPPPCPK